MSKKSCNFVAVFSSRRGYMSFGMGANTDILKKASYALCFGGSESGKFIKFQNIAAQDAHWYVINVGA